MFVFQRSPIPKIVPTVAVFNGNSLIVSESAQSFQPAPQPPVQSFDPVTVGGYLLAVIVSLFAVLPKAVERWLGQELEAKQDQNLITKSQANLELEDKQRQLEAARNLSEFYLETARESQKSERELLMTFVKKELATSEHLRDSLNGLIASHTEIAKKLELVDAAQQKILTNQQHIFKVLKMNENMLLP